MQLNYRTLTDRILIRLFKLIFNRWYKTALSRKIFKSFFKLFQKQTEYKENQKNNFLKDNYVLNNLKIRGWSKILDKNLTKDLIELKNQSICEALKIFNGNFNTNKTGKNYLKGINLSYYPNQIKLFNQFFTHPYFIENISNYLGEEPLLTELKILYSPPMKTKSFSGSQLFHSDYDDEKLVKVFLFLEDVGKENGPTEIIEKEQTKFILNKTNYKWGTKREQFSSHDDNLINVLKDKGKIISLRGSKGSIFFIDTVNCLHRGSRNPDKGRKILYANFSTKTSFRNPPVNWIINNKLSLSISSPLMNLDPNNELDLKFTINNKP